MFSLQEILRNRDIRGLGYATIIKREKWNFSLIIQDKCLSVSGLNDFPNFVPYIPTNDDIKSQDWIIVK